MVRALVPAHKLLSSSTPLPSPQPPPGGKVNPKDSQWLSPLHHAASQGHDSAVKELLKNQADIMARDKNWMTPLHMAAHNNRISCAGGWCGCGCHSVWYVCVCVCEWVDVNHTHKKSISVRVCVCVSEFDVNHT